MQAGTRGTRERYRIDPLYVLGTLPFQRFATEAVERDERLKGVPRRTA